MRTPHGSGRRSGRTLFLLALITAAIPAGASVARDAHAQAADATPPVGELVNRVQAVYDQTRTFKAEFNQVFVAKAYNKTTNQKGHVVFAKPGKMEWVYDGSQDRVVSDGTEVNVYKSADNQVIQQQLKKSQYPAALSFLTGQGKLSEHFNFEVRSGDKMGFPGGYVLIGKPKVANPSAQTVLFYVDAKTSQIRRVMIIDAQQNRNRFDFIAPKVNEPVSDAQFHFVVPKGATVVKP